MSPNPPLKETNKSQDESVETGASCSTGGCPPSHRMARRVSTIIIAVLLILIVAVGIWVMIGNRAG